MDHGRHATGTGVVVLVVADDLVPTAALAATGAAVVVLVAPDATPPPRPAELLGSATVATATEPVTDATKRVADDGTVLDAVDRSGLRRPVLPVVARVDAVRTVLRHPAPPRTVAELVVALAQLQDASAGATAGGAIPIMSSGR